MTERVRPQALRGEAEAGAESTRRARLQALPGGAEAGGRRGLVAGALAAAGSFLLEPAVPPPARVLPSPRELRPVVAVFGLARKCGVTVVSRALAVELAGRDPEGAAAVHCEVRGAGIPLATRAASRLAQALAEVPGADTRAVGRLSLVAGTDRGELADSARHLAPLVLDAGSDSLGGAAAAVADRAIVVATPATEPALAAVAAHCLGRLGHDPIVVLNRAPPTGSRLAASDSAAGPGGEIGGEAGPSGLDAADPASAWSNRAVHRLPDSRMGAQFALGGREARGELGRAIAELADICERP
jgi:hypothetical protein